MASQHVYLHPEQSPHELMPKRRRKHRIFDNFDTRQKTEEAADSFQHCLQIPKVNSEIYRVKEPQKGFVKIPRKASEDNDFGVQEQQDAPFNYNCIDAIKTVGSQKFGQTGSFLKILEQPSVFVRGTKSCINEASALFISVSELKSNFECLSGEAGKLSASIMEIEWAVNEHKEEAENDMQKVRKLQEEINAMKQEQKNYSVRLQQLDQKLDALELRNAMAGQLQDAQKEQQIKQFINQRGYTFPVLSEQEDQFVQTQFLPAHLIAQFIELRRQKSLERKQVKILEGQQKRIAQTVQSFHPCLGITLEKYKTLCQYVSQEHSGRSAEDVRLSLLFRRGTDLDWEWVGSRESLQYKESLLFVLKNSFGQCLGGYISNYYIQEEVREDEHAFLFCFDKEASYKFKVKSELRKQAYEASKHYLVCFGSDLMLSADCLQEESYCEWPNIYSQDTKCAPMVALAGEFSFMIEHLEVYEVSV